MESISASFRKQAACACGGLTVSVTAPPVAVQACACLDCQRRTGSALSYSAFFRESDVVIAGEARSWRRSSAAGRWHESHFCPSCGVCAFITLEATPGLVAVPVGGFADPEFAQPAKLYWASRRHGWLHLPPDADVLERQ